MKNFALFLLVATLAVPALAQTRDGKQVKLNPNEQRLQQQVAPPAGSKITYHNGTILWNAPTVYIVYYGSFSTTTNDIAVINNFASKIGGTGQYNVNSTYNDKNNNFIKNQLAFNSTKNTYQDNYSLGKNVPVNGVATIVQNAIAKANWPSSTNAVYFVFTSPDVTSPDFAGACGWHDWTTKITTGKLLAYSWVGEIAGCNGNEAIFHETNSPNNSLALDAALDTYMHELSEAATDPTGKGWFTSDGSENGDLCNFVYGTTFLATNGTHANVTLGAYSYLVQNIWENSGNGFCANTK